MTRRTLLLALLAPKRPPNVILILTDDQGYGDLSCYGAKDIRTPHIDQLAKEGMRFTDFYAAPICSPSRAALLTGCYPMRVGIPKVLNSNSPNGIADKEKLLPEILKEKGYATAIYGKWHLGDRPQFNPLRHGFDEYFGTPGSNDMGSNMDLAARQAGKAGVALIEGEKQIETDPDQSQLAHRYTARAIQFMERNRSKPFFLYLPHNMPHTPIFATAPFQGKSGRGLYGDVVQEIDSTVGELMAAVKRLNLDNDTLIIFTSDNGPWLIFGDHGGSPEPLRGGKREALEGGFRVPAIFRYKGKIPAGRTCREMASNMDILPTIAKLAGGTLPAHPIDGRDIWPLLEGRKNARTPHEAFFFYYQDELRAVRSGKWKLILPHTDEAVPDPAKIGMGGKRGGVKSVTYQQALFNLETDPKETTDLSSQNPDTVKKLMALVEAMRAELGDSITHRKGSRTRS
ncbi:MAG: sulfatase [Acidobacteria bacterium]|nr:sulfatase [Acidobacteriota bacterium]